MDEIKVKLIIYIVEQLRVWDGKGLYRIDSIDFSANTVTAQTKLGGVGKVFKGHECQIVKLMDLLENNLEWMEKQEEDWMADWN